MRILCTNDDGIHAPGLKIVEQIARELSDDVWVVAPELDQSGVSHSLSLNDPLRLREVGPRHFAVRGTPTDCVIMGARHILGEPSCRTSCSPASTRAATSPRTWSIPAPSPARWKARSWGCRRLRCRRNSRWRPARSRCGKPRLQFGPPILRKVIDAGVPKDTVINVNFPACAPEEVAGVRVTRQGKRNLGFLKVDQRRDGRGNPYFWIGFERLAQGRCAGRGHGPLGAGGALCLGDAAAAGPHRRSVFRRR